jgi:hypothetical protein
MQQAVAPSSSLGDTLSQKDTARPISLSGWSWYQAYGLLVGIAMWRIEDPALPGPCSWAEARLYLSAAVLRSTTLASQPGHSPQPLGGHKALVPQEGPRELQWLGGKEPGQRCAFCWERPWEGRPGARNELWSKYCRAIGGGIHFWKITDLSLFLKENTIAVAWFCFSCLNRLF